MRPHFHWLWLLTFGLMTAGCATTSDKQAAVRPLWKSPQAFAKEQEAAQKKAASKTDDMEVAAKSSNPFRKTANSEKSASTKPDAKPAAKDPVQQETAKADTSGVKSETAPKAADAKTAGVFGPETLRLIDAELIDASAEERAFWYDQLKKVDPAVIPQILEARRLTAQVAEQHQPAASPSNEQFVQQAGGTQDTSKSSPVVQADGRRFPDENDDYRSAHYETDGLAVKSPIVRQNYETPAPTTAKKPFAVTKIADAGPAVLPANPPASPATGSASRNPLTRFLPMGQAGAVTHAAANSPSGVSLLPPSDTDHRDAQSRLSELISLAEADVAQLQPGTTEAAQTEYIQHHVYLRLLYLMADHPERALTAIPGVEPADQEYWQQMLWAMANYFDTQHLPTAKDRAGQAVAQLTTAAQRLREKADLEVRNMAFCREISYFGNFVRFPRDEFRPGDSALLYAEIENFKSEMTIDGQYRTLIRSTVEILSPSGEVRWHKEFAATEDLCINYRRDYFHNYQFTIPDRLPLGPHQLKLTVFDELSGKMVSQSINFVVR